jgi:hypothetical protein
VDICKGARYMKCEYHGQKKSICLHKDHKQPDVTYGYCYGICKEAKIIKKQKKQCGNCNWWGKDEWRVGLRSCDNENIIFQTQCSEEECYGYILTAKTFKCKYYKRNKQ